MDGSDRKDAYFNGSTLYYVLDALLAMRTLYSFLKTYFRVKFEKQGTLVSPDSNKSDGKQVRVYMDGCFDMMHFGHANALRQAKSLGHVLVVGICPDEEIMRNKGPPVMNNEERYLAVESVKWVDEIISNVPYDVTPEFLDKLINEHQIDYIVHGDDPCVGPDGRDVYAAVKKAGRFKTIKRTEGVSSTDIVGRMLLCTRDHHLDNSTEDDSGLNKRSSINGRSVRSLAEGGDKSMPFTRVSTFLPTTRRLIQFAGGSNPPKANGKVVYIDGAFDMFHGGHIQTLKAARELGDFVLAGIHDDATVNAYKGRNFPIMNLHERTLSVLSSRYVDEVIIGAPRIMTEDMIKTMNISVVVHGTHYDEREPDAEVDESDPYEIPKAMGIFQEIESKSQLSVFNIINRIVQNREQYIKRNKKKVAQEQQYLDGKEYVEEL
mmetsp:Transcript_4355/g.13166  ORF Transcript_4355/g.13166 Transcript_4355/m.13166 type:complete len:434 (+) Transcript_4355:142-1443(+)|eukprot:CAMPEP_0198729046 /NCGR_PEP_ID=MMETSP1475-20131203/14034_1 /TAXON_ID= ORGANISM="Unidentified sp., Strain CCMP1999" /NCGR_SAMPLE_ID=MMETSP1475 /ASSEMBLY_ACC=CAM_ASM_001111 /LENGTH=433 /DNA_ID=CAMNT_0044491583 /DNA_START=120 /DNA_END=1421 /DNA_ORIENTATION=-